MKANYLVVVFSVLMISACQPEKKQDPKEFTEVSSYIGLQSVKTESGVECIVYKSTYGGGVSCNWDKYNRLNTKGGE